MNGNKGKPKPWLKGRKAHNRLEFGVGSMNYFYNRYKQTAKQKSLEFDLSIEQFKELTSSNCTYCNVIPYKEITGPRSFGSYKYNGIDRMDSSKGYSYENCVTCCTDCNRAKWEMSLEQFMSYIERISKTFNERGWIDV